MLEREYLFIDVVSTFLRAIRCGAIHTQHGAVILAHYGRLEESFDACSRIVVDVLREENLMKNEPHIIVNTLTQALEEVTSNSVSKVQGTNMCALSRHIPLFSTGLCAMRVMRLT
jgi:hypothetical protein